MRGPGWAQVLVRALLPGVNAVARRATVAQKLAAVRDLTEEFPQSVWNFFQDRAQVYTLQTLKAYAYDLRIFLRWLSDRLRKAPDAIAWDSDVDFRVIRDFFRHLKDYDSQNRFGQRVARTNTLKGEARKFSALAALFEYLVVEGLMNENPVASRERRRQILGRYKLGPTADLPVYLNQDESVRLLRAVDTYAGRDHGASRERDRALLAVLLFTGIRVSELVTLDKQSVEYETTRDPGRPLRAVLRVIGKGEKTRLVALHPVVERLVDTYLQNRPPADGPGEDPAPLFLNRWRRRLSRQAVWDVVAKYARQAGLVYKAKRVSPHKLRHSFATMLLAEGKASLRELQELLGHASVNTTMVYTHVAGERRHRIIEDHPLGDRVPETAPAETPTPGRRAAARTTAPTRAPGRQPRT